jgi:hypothetical protein
LRFKARVAPSSEVTVARRKFVPSRALRFLLAPHGLSDWMADWQAKTVRLFEGKSETLIVSVYSTNASH